RYNADIRATNILLQGLPKDIYTLINHYTDAKDIWDNVKILLEGYEFTKLINDMRNIKMTMPKMQLNSKFINNMFPEWGRFMTTVKLNKGLKESNYDHLYAYLKQPEAHANENKMMLERYNQHAIDPLALVSNVSPQYYPSQSSVIPPSTYVPPVNYQPQFADNTQLDSGFTLTDDLIENLTKTITLLAQSYKTHIPQTNNQLRTSSNTRNQATIQNGKVVVQNVQGRQNRGQRNYARGAVAAGNRGVQNRVGNLNPGQAWQIKCYNCNGIEHIARNCTQPKRPQNSEYFNDKIEQTNTFDDDVDEEPIQDLALNEDNVFQADQFDAFDSDVDEAPTAQTMFMENLSSADPIYDEHHEVQEMHNDVQPNYVVDSDAKYTSDSNMILYDQYVKDNEEQVVQSNVSSMPNDAYMMIINEMHEQAVQCVFANEQHKVVNTSLTAELARYKEQVELYKKGISLIKCNVNKRF
ncbi:retrovirus-related pol polyprotein from transposon TNT 1-94, partial [Tanacetum coccineum]